jgi:hypothetical protein
VTGLSARPSNQQEQEIRCSSYCSSFPATAAKPPDSWKATKNGSSVVLMTAFFLLVGSLKPNSGGGILAHKTSLSDLQSRVRSDPFVAEDVVSAEILEITPSKADERLQFIFG